MIANRENYDQSFVAHILGTYTVVSLRDMEVGRHSEKPALKPELFCAEGECLNSRTSGP
jgi:hypothetical protein